MPWWNAAEFPWLQEICSARAAIADECEKLRASLPQDYQLQKNEHSLHKGTWDWHSLVTKGSLLPQASLLAPTTTSLLMRVPNLMLDVPFAYAFFSSMATGSEIAPHFGPTNLRLRIHVPLHVPAEPARESGDAVAEPACGIRVAGETRTWDASPGAAPLVFDDAYEHATWNRTGERRDVLLFDVWHPDLLPEEIEGIKGMFAQAKASGWIK